MCGMVGGGGFLIVVVTAVHVPVGQLVRGARRMSSGRNGTTRGRDRIITLSLLYHQSAA